jgi:glycosyltransferase involved in cell wall biosynthesis
LIDIPKLGLTKALNHGLKQASGSYIARQDGGDISDLNRLKYQIEFFDNNPELGLVGTWISEYSESGDHLGDIEFPTTDIELKKHLPFQNGFCHGSVMLNTKVVKNLGGFREQFIKAQDYDLWLRISERFMVANVDKVLYKRTVSRNSITIETKKKQMAYADIARKCFDARQQGNNEPLNLLNSIQINNRMNFKRITDSNYYFYCGRTCFTRRIMKQGRVYFIKSILSNPFKIINFLYLIFSIFPEPILDVVVNTWKALKVKLKIQI